MPRLRAPMLMLSGAAFLGLAGCSPSERDSQLVQCRIEAESRIPAVQHPLRGQSIVRCMADKGAVFKAAHGRCTTDQGPWFSICYQEPAP